MNKSAAKNMLYFFIITLLIALAITSHDAINSNVYASLAIIIGALAHQNNSQKNTDKYE